MPDTAPSEVAQVSDLLYRRLSVGCTPKQEEAARMSVVCRLETRDMAGWRAALRCPVSWCCARRVLHWRLIPFATKPVFGSMKQSLNIRLMLVNRQHPHR